MTIDSPRLQHLAVALDQGDRNALTAFWAEMAAIGTPLIEPLGAGNCLVTFLWRDPGNTQEVVVIQDWGTDGIRYRRASAPGGWSTVWGQVPRVTDPAWIAISSDQLTVEQLIDALRSMKSAPATAKSPCPATACG